MVLSDAPNFIPLPGNLMLRLLWRPTLLPRLLVLHLLTYVMLGALIQRSRLFAVVSAYFVNFEALSLGFM